MSVCLAVCRYVSNKNSQRLGSPAVQAWECALRINKKQLWSIKQAMAKSVYQIENPYVLVKGVAEAMAAQKGSMGADFNVEARGCFLLCAGPCTHNPRSHTHTSVGHGQDPCNPHDNM